MKGIEILDDIDELVSHNIDIEPVEYDKYGIYINTSLRIKSKGRKSIIRYYKMKNIIEESKINNQLKTIIKNQILELLKDGFNYNISKYIKQKNNTKKKENNDSKVTNINNKKENDKDNSNDNNKLNYTKEDLSEEDWNLWTEKSEIVFKEEINKLGKIKDYLNLENNSKLKKYVKEFDKNMDCEQDITDLIINKNIEDFIEFMRNQYVKKQKKVG